MLGLFIPLTTLFIIIYVIYQGYIRKRKVQHSSNLITKKVPLSVNFHFTRRCNYECGFCFHTAKSSHLSSLEDSKTVLKKLAIAGMKKINFAGGEPSLYPKYLEELMRFCRLELMLES